MVKDYLEKKLKDKVSDEEFDFAGKIVKNFIMTECGGSVSIDTLNDLMLKTMINLRAYKLFKKEEWQI